MTKWFYITLALSLVTLIIIWTYPFSGSEQIVEVLPSPRLEELSDPTNLTPKNNKHQVTDPISYQHNVIEEIKGLITYLLVSANTFFGVVIMYKKAFVKK